MSELHFKKRELVLQCSILLEASLNNLFQFIFRLSSDTHQTKTLGNSSTSLSLNNKIFLLSDFGYITDTERTKFLKFSEIRNQFIHNYNCNSFEDLENINIDLYKFLNKIEKDITLDEKFSKLFLDLTEIIYRMDKEVKEHALKEMHNLINKDVLSNIWKIINKSKNDYFIKNDITEPEVYNPWNPANYINGFITVLAENIELQYKESQQELFIKSDEGINFLLRKKKG
jgi:hypothetical protein